MAAARKSQDPVLHELPEELLLQVFSHLTELGPSYETGDDPWFIKKIPFRARDREDQPHPGLRSYPFLGQVCRKWKDLLNTPHAEKVLWEDVVIDFGHELVTAIHTPLIWSNQRPTAEEFASKLAATSLSVDKVLKFVVGKERAIKSISFCNSEGFWGEDGDYLSLNNKHNFQASHLGAVLGILRDGLQELKLYNCNDLINTDHGLWTLVGLCPQLRVLVVEGVNCRINASTVSQLANLPKLEQLTITGDEQTTAPVWASGLDGVPPSWSQLTKLTCLELRCHQLLDTVPAWLTGLKGLRKLDISMNPAIQVDNVTLLTQLDTLVMQKLDFGQPAVPGEPVSLSAKRTLPDLAPLAKNLTALSLARNRFTRVPACLNKLSALEILDLNSNKELTIPSPLTPLLTALPRVSILDFRGVHKEKGAYWSDAKCLTMKHVAAMAKLLKRRKYAHRVLMDTQ